MAPCGILMFAAETLHPTSKAPPESPTAINGCNLIIQRVARKATANGCPDTARWLDQLTAPGVRERRAAADELVSWMTFTEFRNAITSTNT